MLVENNKFAILALHDCSSRLKSVVQIDSHHAVYPELPFKIDYSLWQKWLGTIHAEQILESNLFLLAACPSQKPKVLDQENEDLSLEVSLMLYTLLIVGVPDYEASSILTGSFTDGAVEIR